MKTLFTALILAFCVSGCITPIGMYGAATETTVATSDIEMYGDGVDKMVVKATINPIADTYSGDVGLDVQGVTKVVSKGNMKRRRVAGRALSESSITYGTYKKGSGDTDDKSTDDHALNYWSVEGGGILHDIIWKMGVHPERANIPELDCDDSDE